MTWLDPRRTQKQENLKKKFTSESNKFWKQENLRPFYSEKLPKNYF